MVRRNYSVHFSMKNAPRVAHIVAYVTSVDLAVRIPPEQGPIKRPRRQVAYYPNMTATTKAAQIVQRSAAKRESVMVLRSIGQPLHYFTKTGITVNKKCVFFVLSEHA